MRQTNEAPQRASPGSRRLSSRTLLLAGGLLVAALAVVWSVAANRRGNDSLPTSSVAAEQLISEAGRLARAGRNAEALAALAKARRINPSSTAPYLLRAELLSRIGRYREAREEALAAHRIAPNDPEVTLDVLHRTPGSSPPAEAEALARQAVTQAPQSAEAHDLLGMAIANAGDPKRYPEALKELREANRLDPAAADTLIELGKLYRLMRDNAQAETMLEAAAKLLDREDRKMPLREMEDWLKQRRAAAFWLAQVYRRMGRAAESQAAYAEAARWSERARELKTLRDRAAADPPDMTARARLQAIAQRGLDFWRD